MVVLVGGELVFDIVEPMLQNGELNLDAVVQPNPLLFAHRAVRAAANQVAQVLHLANQLHGYPTRRFTHFKGPVNVKAD
ncbi:MAG TPA: hypothetical protein EYQ67_06925 [Dehalococcoidia bacterium]|nr:hypothetical protein [Dehalococcoidia bacterium]